MLLPLLGGTFITGSGRIHLKFSSEPEASNCREAEEKCHGPTMNPVYDENTECHRGEEGPTPAVLPRRGDAVCAGE